MHINNRPATANSILKQGLSAKKITDETSLNDSSIFSQSNIVLEVSGDRNTSGKILSCSNSCLKFLNRSEKDIVGMDISTILPGAIREKHKDWMINYFESGTSKILDKLRKEFVNASDNIIKPIELYVTQYPSFDNGIKYLSLMRPIKEKKSYILAKIDGVIDSYTSEISYLFGKSKCNMKEICPGISNVFDSEEIEKSSYNKEAMKTNFEVSKTNYLSQRDLDLYEGLLSKV